MLPQLCDYLHPAFAKHLLPKTIRTIFQLGCEDATDTIVLRDTFNAHVHAFECNPDMLPKTRLTLSGQSRITLVERAVWDSEGEIRFYPVTRTIDSRGREITNWGASSCFRARPDYHRQYEQKHVFVQAIRLDNYCQSQGIREIDLLCMDVQGAELRALRGLGKLISQVRSIVSEIERRPIYYDQDLYPEVDSYLLAASFHQVVEVYRDRWFSDFLYEHNSS